MSIRSDIQEKLWNIIRYSIQLFPYNRVQYKLLKLSSLSKIVIILQIVWNKNVYIYQKQWHGSIFSRTKLFSEFFV